MSLLNTQLLKTPATHSPTISHVLDDFVAQLNNLASTISLVPTSFFRAGVIKVLDHIVYGELTIVSRGETFVFGKSSPFYDRENLKATLRINDEKFWTRIALFGDLGFAESFMEGQIDCSDIASLLRIFLANRPSLNGLSDNMSPILTVGRHLTAYKFLGDMSTSRANISAHYDLGNTLFSSFLSEDMNYSSALFKDFNEDQILGTGSNCTESLEQAQLRKMRNLIQKMKPRPGDRILEIGTGWGSLSILLAQYVDCTIDTITLSSEQRDLAQKRILNAGLSSRITVHLMDFREIKSNPSWKGAFDKFVSVEMIENVGREFIKEYWEVVDWAMKKDAVGVVQVITQPESKIPGYDKSGVDFVQKWIFPGCYIPSLAFLVDTMDAGSSGQLTIDSVSNIGPHYARTLREWKAKFLRNWEGTIKPALEAQYDLGPEDLEIFKRKWIYYFDYCEAGFATRDLGDHIISFTRPGNFDFGCDVDPSLIQVA